MKQHLLITGGTGSIGDQLVRGALLSDVYEQVWILTRNPPPREKAEGIRFIQGDLTRPDLGLSPIILATVRRVITTVIHAATCSNFTSSLTAQRLTNLGGTAHVIELARQCPLLERFILVSATQAAGDSEGLVPEQAIPQPSSFGNAAQQTLWERERLAMDQWLPIEILRIATVLGCSREPSQAPLDPWHLWLGWMFKGYLPMLPASSATRFDFISTEAVGMTFAHLLKRGYCGNKVYHLSQGTGAPFLRQVLTSLSKTYRRISWEWREDHRSIPATVDESTFNQFQQTIMEGGHPIYSRVADQAQYFLPSLLYPKVYETTNLEALFAGEGQTFQMDWEGCLTRTIERLARHHWQNRPSDTGEIALFSQ